MISRSLRLSSILRRPRLRVALEKQRAELIQLLRSEAQGAVAQMTDLTEDQKARTGPLLDDAIMQLGAAYSVEEALPVACLRGGF